MIIIVGALVLNEQIGYLRNKDLGFDKRNILTINTNPGVLKNYEIFRNESLLNPAIKSIALGAANPMEINGMAWFEWDGREENDKTYFDEATCDYDYLTTFGFTLTEGRNFSKDFPSDTANFIVTEEATKLMGYDNPIGRSLTLDGHKGKIIGVIKDFHNLGIEEAWNPTVLRLAKNNNDFGQWAQVFVRYDPGKLTEALDYIQLVYKKHNPDYPIKLDFVDQSFERQFGTQKIAATLSNCFTALAVIISGLGLFGLALFNTEKRVKEIGIRKVLGASVKGLVILLCRDFVRLVLYAIILGSPFAYYIMQQFLERFPYHTQIKFSMFMIPALAMLVISLSIISYQSIKASLGNVAEALRSE